jgi:hypothetical protein
MHFMKLHKQAAITCATLVVGVAMLTWGGCGYVRDVLVHVDIDSDGMRICVPTLGELAEEFGVWEAACKLCYLMVAAAGAVIACGSALSIVLTSRERNGKRKVGSLASFWPSSGA